jgi:hypothetical protein
MKGITQLSLSASPVLFVAPVVASTVVASVRALGISIAGVPLLILGCGPPT